MKKLSEFRKDADYFTGKASEVSRQLSLAGIAVVWIFKHTNNDVSILPKELVPTVVFFATALMLDLIHYVYAGIAWSIFSRHHEKKNPDKTKDPELRASKFINWPTWILFSGKLISVCIGYILLIKFLVAVWAPIN